MNWEDPIMQWRLSDFDEGTTPPSLTMKQRFQDQPGPQKVFLYEVNYSAMAGVIRANQPLDITRLFVGFNLASVVARRRLRRPDEGPLPALPGGFAVDHLSVADNVQRLADVFVAATVPILGVLPFVLKRYTQTFVAQFVRFFEDIATFAMDKNGERLISAHMDRVVARIVSPQSGLYADGDRLVIVAHSLGAVVAHNHLVRHYPSGGPEVPKIFLTYGAPIGLVCWIWQFLDFDRFQFPEGYGKTGYFCWDPEPSPNQLPLPALRWFNIVNYMDPIATAFPTAYAQLAMDPQILSANLGGGIDHIFLRSGGPFSAPSAHTSYFNSRDGFLELLDRIIGLKPEGLPEPLPPQDAEAQAKKHWQDMARGLRILRRAAWIIGVLFLALYLRMLSGEIVDGQIFLVFPIYAWPPLVVGALAFFQKLLWGSPNKRTGTQDIDSLREVIPPWQPISPRSIATKFRSELEVVPFLLRRYLASGEGDPDPLGSPPRWLYSQTLFFISFIPFVLAFLAPGLLPSYLDTGLNNKIPTWNVWWLLPLAFGTLCCVASPFTRKLLIFGVVPLAAIWWTFGGWSSAVRMMSGGLRGCFFAIVFFGGYVICMAVSEFASRWRDTILSLRKSP